ncbi:uncharacterized protein RAG0_10095 [Rhynchosporium agropyri]|uniref:DUF967 domain protein n=2 Tax=Rhynchosporium TaxID=38037 RepID=A0A1E1KYF7_9HELO|nr:uncharacterized protein RCO7_06377 [Rhynchosporium commune]CZT03286.1 uncharacterized protein RAG0_10095 [Rhynchosporium agropyri]
MLDVDSVRLAQNTPKEKPVPASATQDPGFLDVVSHDPAESDSEAKSLLNRPSANFEWAREDQLSTILESFDDTGSRKSRDELERQKEQEHWPLAPLQEEALRKRAAVVKPRVKRARFAEHISSPGHISKQYREKMSMSGARTAESPRPIAPPPKDLETIEYIDKSLVFEHFTTDDAWQLGSALRNRLLHIPTPVVINISLANQNQILFHTCTHSGVMPDNDTWVSRKRKTVLRWGCSTWYMHCKFEGDEIAFRDKYGLGNSAGEYAIHGGGVPIRVTGVEGVVAVVVVSGLKQHEDHGVIVEVIRELYY